MAGIAYSVVGSACRHRAMYSFPDSVSATLEKQPTQTAQAHNTLTIISTEALSREVMQQARLVATAR